MNDRRNILFLLGISLILLIVVTVLLQLHINYSKPSYILPDAVSYRNGAYLLYRESFSANSIRPFGYSLLIGFPYLFGTVSDLVILRFAVFINIVSWLLTVVVLYKTIARFTTSKVAFLGALIFITCLSHIAGLYQSLSETFFLLVTLSAFYYLLAYIQGGRSNNMLLFIALLCFSVTIRPISLYFALLAAGVGIVYWGANKQWRNVLFVCVYVIATIGLQSFNMHRKFGSYTLSYIQNYTLYTYLMSGAEYFQQGKPGTFGQFYERRMAVTDSILSIYPYESPQYLRHADSFYKANVSLNFASNKVNVLKCMGLNMLGNTRTGSGIIASAKNYSGSNLFTPFQKFCNKLTFWQNILFTIALVICGFWVVFLLLFRYKQHCTVLPFLIPLCLFSAYLFATAGISFWQADRFTFILFPFTLILMAYLFSHHSTAYREVTGT